MMIITHWLDYPGNKMTARYKFMMIITQLDYPGNKMATRYKFANRIPNHALVNDGKNNERYHYARRYQCT